MFGFHVSLKIEPGINNRLAKVTLNPQLQMSGFNMPNTIFVLIGCVSTGFAPRTTICPHQKLFHT